MRNLSSLFCNQESGFISKLDLTLSQKNYLKQCKIKIRDHLRDGISLIIKEQYETQIHPRFMSQGSSVYKTQNRPCSIPPQQIDHDLGCYLPLSYVEETDQPVIASKIFFEIVDELLELLVRKEKWVAIIKTKKTCSRVILNNEMHIDIPLYSIPDEEFHTVTEVAKSHNVILNDLRMDYISTDEWEEIKDQVLLAHREEGWKASDPRKLNKHFSRMFMVKGEQFRRICRYLKAFRDFYWKESGPSSIYLMILADEIFISEMKSRDDLSLLNIINKIPEKLLMPRYNPTDRNEIIHIDEDDLKSFGNYIEKFGLDLNEAIYSNITSNKSCELVRRHLGSRFPIHNNLPFDDNIRREVLKTPVTPKEDRKPEKRGRAG